MFNNKNKNILTVRDSYYVYAFEKFAQDDEINKCQLALEIYLWIEELVNKSQIYQFKELVDVYYPEAGFTISEDAENMTASIIASITKSLTNLGILNNFYKTNCIY